MLLFEVSPNTERSRLTCTAGLLHVRLHAVVVREHRRRGSDLGSHVADRCHSCTPKLSGWSETLFLQSWLHFLITKRTRAASRPRGGRTRARDGVNSGSVVLHDGSGAALHGQDASDLQDDVLGRGPTRQGPGQLHSNHLTNEEAQVEKRREQKQRTHILHLSLSIKQILNELIPTSN